MQEEYDALIKNQTWELVTRDLSNTVVDCKWLYRIKRKANGSIDRFRALLVAKGFTQHTGLDFHETFSPIVKPATDRTKSGTSLFVWKHMAVTICVLVYVDDIIITGNHPKVIKFFINSLAARFSLKDLGYLNYFLGVDIKHIPDGLILSQSKYILDILSELDMENYKGVYTPMCSIVPLRVVDGSPHTDVTRYRRTLGKLQYLSLTWPDISYAVNKLSQFLHIPIDEHWKAVKRVLWYLKETASLGLRIIHSSDSNLYMYVDADWAANPNDRISTSGYILFFGPNPVSWSLKKQCVVARSSTEAEYKFVANALAELTWVRNLLHKLHVTISKTPTIYCDNVRVTYLSHNPVFHTRMKHVVVDFAYVRDQVQDHRVHVTHTHACDQLADTFTKPLPKSAFTRCRSKLGIIAPCVPRRGVLTISVGC
ncbi:uncharacterized mitochondrial protein AtMg00810-like [Solanum tuberosum]|uniref:uncharacterized mitochondrial protein AtMg00810-like n=1 Tax=Solanum tuberosum TaxID=4113 RepID=UPI000739F91F|nr:PREDICTED: uncharacterized mitochondrial protein AtMg00810-like [Solanum tuberosum]